MLISSVSVMRSYEYCELPGYYYQPGGCFAMSSYGNRNGIHTVMI